MVRTTEPASGNLQSIRHAANGSQSEVPKSLDFSPRAPVILEALSNPCTPQNSAREYRTCCNRCGTTRSGSGSSSSSRSSAASCCSRPPASPAARPSPPRPPWARSTGPRSPTSPGRTRRSSSSSNRSSRSAAGLTLDERAQIETQAFNDLVNDILLKQQYEKRGIRVTDDEIISAARTSPPPQFLQAPELQTEGQFDPSKYQRFLASPTARQQGMLAQLETYYRNGAAQAEALQRDRGRHLRLRHAALARLARRARLRHGLRRRVQARGHQGADGRRHRRRDAEVLRRPHEGLRPSGARVALDRGDRPTAHRGRHGRDAEEGPGASRRDREGREVRGRRQARVRRHGERPRRRQADDERQGHVRPGVRGRRVQAQGRRAVRSRCSRGSGITSSASTSARATRSRCTTS